MSPNETPWQTYRRLLVFAQPYRGLLMMAALGMLIEAAAGGGFLMLMSPITNNLVNPKDINGWMPLAIIGLFLLRGIAGYLTDIGMGRAARSIGVFTSQICAAARSSPACRISSPVTRSATRNRLRARIDPAPAAAQAAIARGRLMEVLGAEFFPREEHDNLFITGAFSLLDRLLGAPMDKVLEEMSLPDRISDALLGQDGAYTPFLKLARACEDASADALSELTHALGLSADAVAGLVRRIKRIWVTLGIIATVVFTAWCLIAYYANAEGRRAAVGDARVSVEHRESRWVFLPRTRPPQATGLLFYAGALVDPRAYARTAHRLAEAGYPAVIVELPRRGAFGGAEGSPVLARGHDAMAALPGVQYPHLMNLGYCRPAS